MSDNKTITMTGCVENISSASSSGATSHGFLLANAVTADTRGSSTTAMATPGSTEGSTAQRPVPGTTAAGTPTGTSGTAAAGTPTSGTYPAASGGATMAHPSASSTTSSYRLEGRDSELKNHVGHKVEVTGTLEQTTGMSKGSSSTASTASPSRSASGTSDNAQQLHVTSVRMIASDCSSK